jgi:hypothetical protein
MLEALLGYLTIMAICSYLRAKLQRAHSKGFMLGRYVDQRVSV